MNKFNFTDLPEGFRLGTKEDSPLILLTLAQAFADYKYPIPSIETSYSALLRYNYDFFTYVIDNAFDCGVVLANQDFSAVLIVVPLDKVCVTPQEILAEHMRENATEEVVDNMCAIMDHIADIEKDLTFRKDTVYIEAIAVQTPKQGNKLGSNLMRHLFKECDAKGYDILLYTNTLKNKAIYDHLGFDTILDDHCQELNSDTYIMLRRCKN